MKLKKKEDKSVYALVLLRRGNKILMRGKTETKCGAETEGKAIQRLPHLGIHPTCKQGYTISSLYHYLLQRSTKVLKQFSNTQNR